MLYENLIFNPSRVALKKSDTIDKNKLHKKSIVSVVRLFTSFLNNIPYRNDVDEEKNIY